MRSTVSSTGWRIAAIATVAAWSLGAVAAQAKDVSVVTDFGPSKNVLWVTEIPGLKLSVPKDGATAGERETIEVKGQTGSSPLVVGDRCFTLAEPNRLLCLRLADGKILWERAIRTEEAVADPKVAKVFDELAELAAETYHRGNWRHFRGTDFGKRGKETLDRLAARLAPAPMPEAYREEGLTMPSPCSDGKYVYARTCMGPVACFDLNGVHQWTRNLFDIDPTYRLGSGSKVYPEGYTDPVLVGDKLVIFMHLQVWNERGRPYTRKQWLTALNTADGSAAWESEPLEVGVASLGSIEIGDEWYLLPFDGKVIRARDGKTVGTAGVSGVSLPMPGNRRLYAWAVLPHVADSGAKIPMLEFSEAAGKIRAKTLWEADIRGTLIPVGDSLFSLALGGTKRGTVRCFGLAGGLEKKVEGAFKGARPPLHLENAPSPAACGGILFAPTWDGRIYVIGPDGEDVDWKTVNMVDMGEPIRSRIVFTPEGRMLVRTHTKMYCIGK